MRVKTGIIRHKKHKKLLSMVKGYRMSRNRLIKKAQEAVLHAGEYAFAGRKDRKRDFRSLWITRINAAVRPHGLSYSLFIKALKDKNIELDRKILSQLAVEQPEVFSEIVETVKK